MSKLLTEFIGTFFLVLTICLAAGGKNQDHAPLAIGAVLMVMVYMGGHISGAHYNPAVSLAVLIRGKMTAIDFASYVVVQVLGATGAAFVAYLIRDYRTLEIKPAGDLKSALPVEVLYTFALALVVLNVATSRKTEGNSYYGLAIGFTLAAGAFAAGPISGGAFNPAVGSGLTLIHGVFGNGAYEFLWYYLVGPFAGGALAAVVFKIQEAGS